MKTLVPNPEYEQAEYEEAFECRGFDETVRIPNAARFRAKDLDEVLRRRAAGKPYLDLAVPSHILAESKPFEKLPLDWCGDRWDF